MTSDQENILTAVGLHKSYGRGDLRSHVLRGLDLTVRRGEFLAVMGPSGCGKSTLLHVLGLMTPLDADERGAAMGSIRMDGIDVPNNKEGDRNRLRRTHIGFVFQRFNLIGVLTARDNIEISMRVRGLPSGGRAMELLDALGVAHLAGRKPSAMSIGEQQRVAMARAAAHRPALLLADEPTGNLDSANAAGLLELLRSMNRSHGQTIVMITHSPEAAAYADRTVTMRDGVTCG